MTSTHYMTIEQMAKLVASFDYFELIDFFEAMPDEKLAALHAVLCDRISKRKRRVENELIR